jgi:glutaminyl-peptide cyclotransferase
MHAIVPVAALLLTIACPGVSASAAEAPGSTPSWAPAAPPQTPPLLGWEIVSRRPHDAGAWTQGLQLDEKGRLFESTGLRGQSSLREVDPASGAVVRSVALPEEQFGEGLALVEERFIQLTWQEGVANVFDRESFDLMGTHGYSGEGWGLCFDGERLVMSDGSSTLTSRDPDTFEIVGRTEVTLAGESAGRLNELECVEDHVWANLYLTARIARIDPASGVVDGLLDLSALEQAQPDDASVLNGIAWDPASETFLVTGKLWPELYEIRLTPPG